MLNLQQGTAQLVAFVPHQRFEAFRGPGESALPGLDQVGSDAFVNSSTVFSGIPEYPFLKLASPGPAHLVSTKYRQISARTRATKTQN